MSTLLPCPFCGGSSQKFIDAGTSDGYIECPNCCYVFGDEPDYKKVLVDKWNRRATTKQERKK